MKPKPDKGAVVRDILDVLVPTALSEVSPLWKRWEAALDRIPVDLLQAIDEEFSRADQP